ncbi:Ankyrin repeat [Musa troglodytarum]|uniref:Ankyrin repeat n=1 Tax=Musa troglodytarum TaxID=320322 RepID=A0A9E7JJI0_9LILI|nr:Ankyrin repeat [Musa troglodytarum]
MENSYSKFHAHTGRTTKYRGPPPPSCEGIFPRDYTIVSPLVGLISAHTANFLAFNQVCITAASSLEAPRRHTARRWRPGAASRRKNRFPKGAANLPFSTPPRGTGTSPRSSRSATLIPRRQFSRSPFPDTTVVIRFLCKNKADVGAAMDDTTAIHFAAQGSYYPLARPANRKALTPLHYAVQGSHLELIEYLVRKGASVTAMTKAGQTPIDRVSTEEVRALLVECKQPLTKDDKSTTILEVGDSVSKEHIKENNGGSFAEETANVDEEGMRMKNRTQIRKAPIIFTQLRSSLYLKQAFAVMNEKFSHFPIKWYGRMESRRIMFSFDVVGPSKCMFHRYRSMASSSQFV